jgi:hypothetical protein
LGSKRTTMRTTRHETQLRRYGMPAEGPLVLNGLHNPAIKNKNT